MSSNLEMIYGTGDENSFIVRYFEDFYCEIIRQKERILATPYMPASSDETEGTEAEPLPEAYPDPASVLDALESLLQSQAIDAARHGGEFASKYYEEAQYVMASLADEVFLHLDWHGKPFWESNMLELRLFGTHSAGETIFKRLEKFLHLRDPVRADIAMVYLLTLGLGFKGRYRTLTDAGDLDRYRRQLYIFIHHRDPSLFREHTHLFPESYLHTLEEGTLKYLHDFRPWAFLFSGLLLLFLFASYSVWHTATSDVHSAAQRILDQSREKR